MQGSGPPVLDVALGSGVRGGKSSLSSLDRNTLTQILLIPQLLDGTNSVA